MTSHPLDVVVRQVYQEGHDQLTRLSGVPGSLENIILSGIEKMKRMSYSGEMKLILLGIDRNALI